jgi:hypothetical protein
MIVAVPSFDETFGFPRFSRGANGISATVPYRVNTSECDMAVQAPNLPAPGTPHPTIAGSVVTGIEAEYVSGGDTGPGNTGNGWCRVVVTYGPLVTAWGPADQAVSGSAYSEIGVSSGQTTVRTDIEGVPIGADVSAEASSAELIIHAFRNNMNWLAPASLILNKGNQNTVTAPPLYGQGGSITILPETILLRSFSARAVREGLIEVSYVFGIGATKWYYARGWTVDADGLPGDPFEKDVQGKVNYPTGLW